MRETIKINSRQLPVILRKFRENPSRLRQLSVIKKTQKFSKIRKIDKKLLKSSKNCYTGNIFKAAEKRAAKGFDRTCRKRLFGLCGGRGARLPFGGAFAHIDLFVDPVWSRYLCGVMFAALRVAVPLRLWRCVLSRFLLLLVALIDRYRCYGVVLMALRTFARLCLRFTGHFDFAPLKLTIAAALCFCFWGFLRQEVLGFLSYWSVRPLFCVVSRGDERCL